MIYANPSAFLLLLLLPLMWFFWFRRLRSLAFGYSNVEIIKNKASKVDFRTHLYPLIRTIIFVLLIIALARPQLVSSESKSLLQAHDIILVIDTSESMAALDFKIAGQQTDRLTVVKSVVEDFIKSRSSDRIGLVVFGEYAMTLAPLTFDHQFLLNFIRQSTIGMAGRSTAIGDALSVATNRLQDVNSKEKIIILLTDGENNAGSVQPLDATKAAAALKTKVYTIAMGIDDHVPFPVKGPFGTSIQYVNFKVNYELLEKISEITNAKAYKATNTTDLKDIYDEIDKLETTDVETNIKQNFEDKSDHYMQGALIFLLFELILAASYWRRIP